MAGEPEAAPIIAQRRRRRKSQLGAFRAMRPPLKAPPFGWSWRGCRSRNVMPRLKTSAPPSRTSFATGAAAYIRFCARFDAAFTAASRSTEAATPWTNRQAAEKHPAEIAIEFGGPGANQGANPAVPATTNSPFANKRMKPPDRNQKWLGVGETSASGNA